MRLQLDQWARGKSTGCIIRFTGKVQCTPRRPVSKMNSAISTATVEQRRKCSSLQECGEIAFEPVQHFAANTSVHGFKYALHPRRRFVERCIWVTSVVVCTLGAAALVYTSLQKFYNNPTLTTIRSFTNETHNLPFPSVTFCNVNLVFRYKASRLLQTLKIPDQVNMSQERLIEILPNVAGLLRPHVHFSEKTEDELRVLQEIFDANNISTSKVVKMLSQSCDDMVERCRWNGVLINCTLHIKRRATLNGYCCSFNYDDNTKWTGHPDKNPYKLRTFEFGVGSGLQVLLNTMKEDYMWGSYMASGFSVVIHRSGLYPEGSWWFVGEGEAFIRVTPGFTDGDRKLSTVQPERRKCTFFNERRLNTSKTYSRVACALECRAHVVQSLCGCVPIYYNKQQQDSSAEKSTGNSRGMAVSNSLTSCNLNHIKCLREHSGIIESENAIDKCNCWSECTLLSYSIDISKSNLDAVEHCVGDFYDGVNTSGRVSINVFYGSYVAQLTKKDIIYTIEQLMSNLGGIFSLLLGCSFLSAMEIVYYALLRAPKICAGFIKGSVRLKHSSAKMNSP